MSINFWVKFWHVISELEDIWAATKQMKSTEAASAVALDVFTHSFMQDINAFNMQLQIHKYCFDILNTERWILIFKII